MDALDLRGDADELVAVARRQHLLVALDEHEAELVAAMRAERDWLKAVRAAPGDRPDCTGPVAGGARGAARTSVIPTDTPESLPEPDLIVVPGSGNPVPVMSDQVLLDWLRAAAPRCQTASVCTGAGLYAAAGLLECRQQPGTRTPTRPGSGR
jgi:transcriptional regulator GlxA family with amidase domain